MAMKVGGLLLLPIHLMTINCQFAYGSAENEDVLRKRLPNAIIIGVKKAGTRALLEYLKLNPDIKSPAPEIHFFDKFYFKGMEWYRKTLCHDPMMKHPFHGFLKKFIILVGDFRTPQLLNDFDLDNIRDFFGKLRLRSTIMYLDYTQNKAKKPRLPSFPRMAFLTSSTTKSLMVNSSWSAIKIGHYDKYLKRWLKYFPLRQIHIVDGSKLVTNPASESRSVEQFLGVKKPIIVVNNFVFKNMSRSGSWPKPIDFPCLLTEINPIAKCLGKTKGRRHVDVTWKLKQILRDYFRPHNEQFFASIKRRFDWENMVY